MLEKQYYGETVEAAIQKGLDDLNLVERQVRIDVINPGKKGFLGIGKADAEVKLTVIDPELKRLSSIEEVLNREQVEEQPSSPLNNVENEVLSEEVESTIPTKESSETVSQNSKQDSRQTALHQTEAYIISVIEHMGLNVSSTSTIKNSGEVIINLESADPARIIGKRGQILNSLQLLAQNFFNQIEKGYTIVTLDIENYREKRKETLQNLALNMSKKAISTNKPVKFEPMPNYERKIMHQILANIENIETYSEGREPHRYLVIKAR